MMSKRLLVGIDVDGVLANFFHGWLDVAGAILEERVPNKEDIDWMAVKDFYFERVFGLTEEENMLIFEGIKKTPNFWFKLKKLSTVTPAFIVKLKELSSRASIFYITNRFETAGKPADVQTQEWISCFLGIKPENFSVIVTSNKSAAAASIGLDVVIEDNPGYLEDYLKLNIPAVFAPRVGYTEDSHPRVILIDKLEDFADYCLEQEVENSYYLSSEEHAR